MCFRSKLVPSKNAPVQLIQAENVKSRAANYFGQPEEQGVLLISQHRRESLTRGEPVSHVTRGEPVSHVTRGEVVSHVVPNSESAPKSELPRSRTEQVAGSRSESSVRSEAPGIKAEVSFTSNTVPSEAAGGRGAVYINCSDANNIPLQNKVLTHLLTCYFIIPVYTVLGLDLHSL